MKRGDVVVVQSERRDYMIGQESTVRTQYAFYTVTSVTRDGVAKALQPVDGDHAVPVSRMRIDFLSRVPDDIDKVALLAEVAAHRWPGHEDSRMIQPWEDREEVVAVVRRHRVKVSS